MPLNSPILTAPHVEELFDTCASDYHRQLNQGVCLSGESVDYFAASRIKATARQATKYRIDVSRILDFGCGVGTASPHLLKSFSGARVVGSDISQRAIDEARSTSTDPRSSWVRDLEGLAPQSIDLVYCNGVFHHIDPSLRDSILDRVCELIRPGGCFALWENNPWNPGTRWVMSRIPFDRDAIRLSHMEASKRLRRAGMDIRTAQHYFYFPRPLAWFRPVEPLLQKIPLGAQYLVFATRP